MSRTSRRAFPEVITLYLSSLQGQRLRAYAQRAGRDLNAVLRDAADQYLDARDAELRASIEQERKQRERAEANRRAAVTAASHGEAEAVHEKQRIVPYVPKRGATAPAGEPQMTTAPAPLSAAVVRPTPPPNPPASLPRGAAKIPEPVQRIIRALPTAEQAEAWEMFGAVAETAAAEPTAALWAALISLPTPAAAVEALRLIMRETRKAVPKVPA